MKEYEKLRLNDCVSSEEEGMLFEQSRSHTREKRTWNFIAQYQWAIQVLLLLTIVGMMIERRWSDNRGLRLGRKYEFGGDVTGFAPKCMFSLFLKGFRNAHFFEVDQRILKFAPDTRFVPSSLADFYNQDVQDAWLSIAPSMH
jgi:hypothetical protein